MLTLRTFNEQPGKRPLSSMSPSILTGADGRVRLVGGASGGPRIITATAQVILNWFEFGESLLDAVIRPRVHSQLLPETVYVEGHSFPLVMPSKRSENVWKLKETTIAASDVTIEALRSRGHNLTLHESNVGITQFIGFHAVLIFYVIYVI